MKPYRLHKVDFNIMVSIWFDFGVLSTLIEVFDNVEDFRDIGRLQAHFS